MILKNNNLGLNRLAREVVELIQDDIEKVGVFHRVFYRIKTSTSTTNKINYKQYDGVEKFLRDIIGIRLVFYFADDLDFVYKFLKEKHKDLYIEESVDEKTVAVFEPTRVNLVFNLPQNLRAEFREMIIDKVIDCTFELQLRTVFSEGWHEIDHDLRYKYKQHWDGHNDLSRTFNGILASLETNDWSIISLFNELSYKHYKDLNIDAMIRTKYRIRFVGDSQLNFELSAILSKDNKICKEIFRTDRQEFLLNLACNNIRFPLTIDNIVYYLNYTYFKNELITKMTPVQLLKDFEEFR